MLAALAGGQKMETWWKGRPDTRIFWDSGSMHVISGSHILAYLAQSPRRMCPANSYHDIVLVPLWQASGGGGRGQGQHLLPSISARMSATSASGAFLRPGVAASMALARGGVGVIDRLGSGGSGVGSFSSGGKNVRDAEPVRPAWCDA